VKPGDVSVEFYRIPEFLNPADPTISADPEFEKTSFKDVICSYAANACVFTGRPALHTVRDGTSFTIGFAEHYARCKLHHFAYSLHGTTSTYGVRGATFANQAQGDVHPVTKNGETVGSVPGVTFQVLPLPEDADGFMPNTSHRSGLLAAMLDGSIRTYAPGVAERVFWSMVTPGGGEVIAE